MIDALTELLVQYKYWIVIAGALLEGEVVLLLAGGAAYHGYMNLSLVMLISFLGAIFHDHMLFFVGRYGGNRLLKKYPIIHEKSRRIFKLFHKYNTYFILSFRFVYGLRTVTPIIIGTSKLHLTKYSTLTILAGLIWAVAVSYIGFGSAAMIERIIQRFEIFQKYFAVALVALALIGWGIYKLRQLYSSSRS